MADLPELAYPPEVLALWNEKDEAASEEWRQQKIKDFEVRAQDPSAGGKTKEKYETMEALQEFMTKTVYGPGGTKVTLQGIASSFASRSCYRS
eukprot:5821199-Pleurochrysis_carterae.AAC.5